MHTIKKNKKKKFIEINNKGEVLLPDTNNNSQKKELKNVLCNPVQILKKEFPNIDESIIDDILDENLRNIDKTRDELLFLNGSQNNFDSKLIQTDNIETKEEKIINNNNNDINQQIQTNNIDKFGDINKFINFEYSDNIDNNNSKNNEEFSIMLIKNTKRIDNKLDFICNKEKTDLNSENYIDNIEVNDKYCMSFIEENNLNVYLNILRECFPNKNNEEILSKICDFNFNIEECLEYFLQENNNEINTDKQNCDITNYLNTEEKEYTNELKYFLENNIQDIVFKELKKSQFKQKLNEEYFNEDHFPYLNNADNNIDKIRNLSLNGNEEDFLCKDIDDIITPSIKSNLKKLINKFPLEDEEEVKFLYYQLMDVNKCSQILIKKGKKHNSLGKLGCLIDNSYHKSANSNTNKRLNAIKSNFDAVNYLKDTNEKNEKTKNNNNLSNAKYSINCNNNQYEYNDTANDNNNDSYKFYPVKNGKMVPNKNVNNNSKRKNNNNKILSVNSINKQRQHMFLLINKAWKSGDKNTAKKLLNKAKKIKYEIYNLMKNREASLELGYNEGVHKFNEIDLHGFTLNESKIIINNKIKNILNAYNKEQIDFKKVYITLITGIGNKLFYGESVLLNNLPIWLKETYPYKINEDRERGLIYIRMSDLI